MCTNTLIYSFSMYGKFVLNDAYVHNDANNAVVG